MSADQRDCLVC